MVRGNGKKGRGNRDVKDLTVEILKDIRANTQKTAQRLSAVETGLSHLRDDVREKFDVLIHGQYELAKNVAQLNGAMVRVVKEVGELRDDRLERLER